MGKFAVLILTLVLGVASLNFGPLVDVLRYRGLTQTAAQILPRDWARRIAGQPPAQALATLQAAQTPAQLAALESAYGLIREGRGGLVLALPDGFETVEMSLTTGCFVHVHRRVTLIVWHYDISTGCLPL